MVVSDDASVGVGSKRLKTAGELEKDVAAMQGELISLGSRLEMALEVMR